jgi:hypothetical protein
MQSKLCIHINCLPENSIICSTRVSGSHVAILRKLFIVLSISEPTRMGLCSVKSFCEPSMIVICVQFDFLWAVFSLICICTSMIVQFNLRANMNDSRVHFDPSLSQHDCELYSVWSVFVPTWLFSLIFEPTRMIAVFILIHLWANMIVICNQFDLSLYQHDCSVQSSSQHEW